MSTKFGNLKMAWAMESSIQILGWEYSDVPSLIYGLSFGHNCVRHVEFLRKSLGSMELPTVIMENDSQEFSVYGKM